MGSGQCWAGLVHVQLQIIGPAAAGAWSASLRLLTVHWMQMCGWVGPTRVRSGLITWCWIFSGLCSFVYIGAFLCGLEQMDLNCRTISFRMCLCSCFMSTWSLPLLSWTRTVQVHVEGLSITAASFKADSPVSGLPSSTTLTILQLRGDSRFQSSNIFQNEPESAEQWLSSLSEIKHLRSTSGSTFKVPRCTSDLQNRRGSKR